MKKTIRCPECDKELYTDGSYLSLAPCKPDPQDDIVEAARHWVNCPGINAFPELDRRIMVFARLVQAGIQKNEKGIEAVRGLFRNHESRLGELDTSTDERTSLVDLVHISSKENLEAACKIEDLERKVEELEEKHDLILSAYTDHLQTDQPQPEQPVAYAWDKEQKVKHELIPGVSVLGLTNKDGSTNDRQHRIFQEMDGSQVRYYYITSCGRIDRSTILVPTDKVVFLFDLDFPGGGK